MKKFGCWKAEELCLQKVYDPGMEEGLNTNTIWMVFESRNVLKTETARKSFSQVLDENNESFYYFEWLFELLGKQIGH